MAGRELQYILKIMPWLDEPAFKSIKTKLRDGVKLNTSDIAILKKQIGSVLTEAQKQAIELGETINGALSTKGIKVNDLVNVLTDLAGAAREFAESGNSIKAWEGVTNSIFKPLGKLEGQVETLITQMATLGGQSAQIAALQTQVDGLSASMSKSAESTSQMVSNTSSGAEKIHKVMARIAAASKDTGGLEARYKALVEYIKTVEGFKMPKFSSMGLKELEAEMDRLDSKWDELSEKYQEDIVAHHNNGKTLPLEYRKEEALIQAQQIALWRAWKTKAPSGGYTQNEINSSIAMIEQGVQAINQTVDDVKAKVKKLENEIGSSLKNSFSKIIAEQISEIQLSLTLPTEDAFVKEINDFVAKINAGDGGKINPVNIGTTVKDVNKSIQSQSTGRVAESDVENGNKQLSPTSQRLEKEILALQEKLSIKNAQLNELKTKQSSTDADGNELTSKQKAGYQTQIERVNKEIQALGSSIADYQYLIQEIESNPGSGIANEVRRWLTTEANIGRTQDRILENTQDWRTRIIEAMTFAAADFKFDFGDAGKNLYDAIDAYFEDPSNRIHVQVDTEGIAEQVKAAVEQGGLTINGGTGGSVSLDKQDLLDVLNAWVGGTSLPAQTPSSTVAPSTSAPAIEPEGEKAAVEEATESSKEYVTQLSATSIHIDKVIEVLKNFAGIANKTDKSSKAIGDVSSGFENLFGAIKDGGITQLDKTVPQVTDLLETIKNFAKEATKTRIDKKTGKTVSAASKGAKQMAKLLADSGIDISAIANGADDDSVIAMLQKTLMTKDNRGNLSGQELMRTLRRETKYATSGASKGIVAISELLSDKGIDIKSITDQTSEADIIKMLQPLFAMGEDGQLVGSSFVSSLLNAFDKLGIDIKSQQGQVIDFVIKHIGELLGINGVNSSTMQAEILRRDSVKASEFALKSGRSLASLDIVRSKFNPYKNFTSIPTLDEINRLIADYEQNGRDTTQLKELAESRDALGFTDVRSVNQLRELGIQEEDIESFRELGLMFREQTKRLRANLEKNWANFEGDILADDGTTYKFRRNTKGYTSPQTVFAIPENAKIVDAAVYNDIATSQFNDQINGSTQNRNNSRAKAKRVEKQLTWQDGKPSYIQRKPNEGYQYTPDDKPIVVTPFKPLKDDKPREVNIDLNLNKVKSQIADVETKLASNELKLEELDAKMKEPEISENDLKRLNDQKKAVQDENASLNAQRDNHKRFEKRLQAQQEYNLLLERELELKTEIESIELLGGDAAAQRDDLGTVQKKIFQTEARLDALGGAFKPVGGKTYTDDQRKEYAIKEAKKYQEKEIEAKAARAIYTDKIKAIETQQQDFAAYGFKARNTSAYRYYGAKKDGLVGEFLGGDYVAAQEAELKEKIKAEVAQRRAEIEAEIKAQSEKDQAQIRQKFDNAVVEGMTRAGLNHMSEEDTKRYLKTDRRGQQLSVNFEKELQAVEYAEKESLEKALEEGVKPIWAKYDQEKKELKKQLIEDFKNSFSLEDGILSAKFKVKNDNGDFVDVVRNIDIATPFTERLADQRAELEDALKKKGIDKALMDAKIGKEEAIRYGDLSESDLLDDDVIQEQIEFRKKIATLEYRKNALRSTGAKKDEQEANYLATQIKYYEELIANRDKLIEIRKKEREKVDLTPEEKRLQAIHNLAKVEENLEKSKERVATREAEYNAAKGTEDEATALKRLNDEKERQASLDKSVTSLKQSVTYWTNKSAEATAKEATASGRQQSNRSSAPLGAIGDHITSAITSKLGDLTPQTSGIATEVTLRAIFDLLSGGDRELANALDQRHQMQMPQHTPDSSLNPTSVHSGNQDTQSYDDIYKQYTSDLTTAGKAIFDELIDVTAATKKAIAKVGKKALVSRMAELAKEIPNEKDQTEQLKKRAKLTAMFYKYQGKGDWKASMGQLTKTDDFKDVTDFQKLLLPSFKARHDAIVEMEKGKSTDKPKVEIQPEVKPKEIQEAVQTATKAEQPKVEVRPEVDYASKEYLAGLMRDALVQAGIDNAEAVKQIDANAEELSGEVRAGVGGNDAKSYVENQIQEWINWLVEIQNNLIEAAKHSLGDTSTNEKLSPEDDYGTPPPEDDGGFYYDEGIAAAEEYAKAIKTVTQGLSGANFNKTITDQQQLATIWDSLSEDVKEAGRTLYKGVKLGVATDRGNELLGYLTNMSKASPSKGTTSPQGGDAITRANIVGRLANALDNAGQTNTLDGLSKVLHDGTPYDVNIVSGVNNIKTKITEENTASPKKSKAKETKEPKEPKDPFDNVVAKYDRKMAYAQSTHILTDEQLKAWETAKAKLKDAKAALNETEESARALAIAQEEAARTGESLARTAERNAKNLVGTNEMRSAERQRDKVLGIAGQDAGFGVGEDGKLMFAGDAPQAVQNYVAAYNELIQQHADYVKQDKIADPQIQEHLRQQAAKVQVLGSKLTAAVKQSQKLQDLAEQSKDVTYYNDKTKEDIALGGQQVISKEQARTNLPEAMEQFAQSTLKADLAHAKFSRTNKTLQFQLRTSKDTVADMVVAYDQLTDSLYMYQKGEKESLTGLKGFIHGMKGKMKGILQYAMNMTSLYQIIGQIRKGLQYIKEIDLALTELRKVTDETEETYDKFLDTAAKTGARLGTPISAVIEATATFAKLGYTMQEASKMAESAIVYKNVGDGIASTEDAADSIISTLKGFGMEASETMRIVDRFNEVGNRFAITSKGIGEALRLSASALNEGGNSLDESIALITAAM